MKFTSPPAQKARPAPVTIIARTSGSRRFLERLSQIAPHVADERVQPFGPVERDRDDALSSATKI
jgi:hypothetical protein